MKLHYMYHYATNILAHISFAEWTGFAVVAVIILTCDKLWNLLNSKRERQYYCNIPLKRKLPCVYTEFILLVTLFIREIGSGGRLAWMPLWSWREVLLHQNLQMLWQILLNILLFLPLGILLELNRRWPTKVILVTGFSLSLGIEVCQLVFRLGWFEWDDILHNGLGCALGVGVVRLIRHIVHTWKQRMNP